MKLADAVLAESNARLKLAVIMDPDGDRVRFSDGENAIEMNAFGPMLAYYLIKEKHLQGGICKSVASSNFANAVASAFDRPCFETQVGFKNFRQYLKNNEAVLAFEESDGITVQGWGLDKDALVGCIAAIDMILETDIPLSDYLETVKEDIGYYYPDKDGEEVDRSLVGPALREKLAPLEQRFAEGSSVSVNGAERTVSEMITLDGHKMVFDNGSWILIRPSGTEPKVRFYVEGRDAEETAALIEKAKEILKSLMS